MVEQSSGGDSLKQLMLSSLQSTGFWSFVAAVVGIVALIAAARCTSRSKRYANSRLR